VGCALVVRRDALDLDDFARAAGLHPDLVRRFVALGLSSRWVCWTPIGTPPAGAGSRPPSSSS
jgi:hypothetical protein